MDLPKVQETIFDSKNENLVKLSQLFPEVVKDGQVDINVLKEILGEYEEVTNEKFELNWAGKQNSKKIAADVLVGKTLKLVSGDGVDEDKTQNLFIEGDNIEVLKLIEQSYYNAIKMIYIDPPYNTGEDFIYKDNFSRTKKEVDEIEGNVLNDERLIVNQKSGNRFHSNWLNMIYPRLKVAHNLLRDDGVIFISISDEEVGSLRLICNEIFGEENFEGHIHWRRRHNQPNDKTKMIGLVAEHILCYAKNSKYLKGFGVGKIGVTGEFSNPDNDPKGPWATKPWKVGSDQSGSKYTITTPTGKVYKEEWMGEEKTFKSLLEDGRILFTKNGDGIPRKKYYQFEREEEGQCATNWWSHEIFGHNQGGNDLMTKLFGVKNLFSNPKPIELIYGMLQVANVKDGDTVLDFFSGSGSTAHAVLKYNEDNKINSKFILVQIPEDLHESLANSTGNAKKTIQNAINYLQSINLQCKLTEIGKERIRRAIAIFKENEDSSDGMDLGFKVLKVDKTNIRWTYEALTEGQIAADEAEMTDKDKLDFLPGTKDIDVIYEVMLRQRDVPLSASVELLSHIGPRTYVFADSYVICLEEDITEELVEKLAAIDPLPIKYVLRDSAFGDNISLKEETFRRLQLLVERNTGVSKKTYTVEFL